jgi:L-fucose mutarotase/ribose pyranase (RbsD/FucU family)
MDFTVCVGNMFDPKTKKPDRPPKWGLYRCRRGGLVTMMIKPQLLLLCCLFAAALPTYAASPDWRTTLKEELPLLGHRNWIVIVDSAYPLQVSPGVETLETNASQEEVVRTVLQELSLAKHVTPVVYMDAELPFIPEQNAPGVTSYRAQIHTALGSLVVHSLPHEQLIKTLGDTGSAFHVLVLKTTLTIPYSSVFLRLDCKYWGDASEQELRKAMQEHAAGTPGTRPQ